MKKQITKLLALVLALSMILALASCGGAAPTQSGGGSDASASGASSQDGQEETDSGADKIGILLPTVEAEYFVGVANTIEEGLSSQGYEFITTSYDWSADKEIQAVENFVVSGVKAIIVVAFDNAADSAFADAMDAGVKVVVAGTGDGAPQLSGYLRQHTGGRVHCQYGSGLGQGQFGRQGADRHSVQRGFRVRCGPDCRYDRRAGAGAAGF